MPASRSRAPASSPPKPPPMISTSTSSNSGSRSSGATYGILDVVLELAGDLDVLVVAVVTEPLVSFGAVLVAQRVGIEVGGGGTHRTVVAVQVQRPRLGPTAARCGHDGPMTVDRDPRDLDTLDRIQRRLLWLAVRMVDHANRERVAPVGDMAIKVGGHQASSASMVSIMTALWFGHLRSDDKVAVKPHASPVYHSIKYLTGELDRSYLTRLREVGGLQAYPSRTKDPDVADFSTGSVGLGAVAPLFAAMTRRYVDAHFERDGPREHPARFIALVGDAELDEGNIWEAIADPSLQGLGSVMWVVDVNRQSLDRVIPDQKIKKLIEFFDGAGWHVIEAKYGRLHERRLRPRRAVTLLRAHIDAMENERYQSLFAVHGAELRDRFLDGADPDLAAFVAAYDDDELERDRHQSRRARPRGAARRVPGVRCGRRSAERRVRLHDQGLGTADRR